LTDFKGESEETYCDKDIFIMNLVNSICALCLLTKATFHGFPAWSWNQRDWLCLKRLQKSM